MVNINLLPWREKHRDLKKKEFNLISLIIVIVTAVTVYAVTQYYAGLQQAQSVRNSSLNVEIRALTKKVTEITALKDQRKEMIARMEVIQSLQGDRPMIVYIFDQLVETLPKGVFFKSVSRNGMKINIVGIAESNSRLSALMRALDASEWFADPRTPDIKAAPEYGQYASQFSLNMTITPPELVLEDEQ